MGSGLLSVYCSGSIRKGPTDVGKLCWSDVERSEVAKGAGREVVFLNPDDPITDPRNTLGQFGRDLYQVMLASAVVVDARQRRGLGVGVEMAAAAAVGTPIIVVAPRNSKYRADTLTYRGVRVTDYVHPHIYGLASAVEEDFVAAGEALASLASLPDRKQRTPAWLNHAVHEYVANVLPGDEPMLEAIHRLHVRAL